MKDVLIFQPSLSGGRTPAVPMSKQVRATMPENAQKQTAQNHVYPPMKSFCFTFSLYFLALSIMPCTDIHTTNDMASAELASFSADNHSDCPHEKGSDHCSPFCMCSCCGHVIAQAKAFQWHFKPILPEGKEKSAFHYAFDWESDYLQAIFRPPQV